MKKVAYNIDYQFYHNSDLKLQNRIENYCLRHDLELSDIAYYDEYLWYKPILKRVVKIGYAWINWGVNMEGKKEIEKFMFTLDIIGLANIPLDRDKNFDEFADLVKDALSECTVIASAEIRSRRYARKKAPKKYEVDING